MANTMQFDLVSPERSLASLSATAVQIPGADGDMTAMLALSIGGAMTTCGLGGVYASFKGDDT